jgi:hypothetical protein
MFANHSWGLSDGAATSPCWFVALNERHDPALTKWTRAIGEGKCRQSGAGEPDTDARTDGAGRRSSAVAAGFVAAV